MNDGTGKKVDVNQKSSFPFIALLVFLAFAAFFSYMRFEISAVNAWILRSIGRGSSVDQTTLFGKKKTGSEKAKTQNTSTKKQKTKPKKRNVTRPRIRRVVSKTETPIVALLLGDKKYDVDLPKCAPLRLFDGRNGSPRTDILLTSDGKKLFLLAICYDNSPDDIIVSHSEKEGPSAAFKDDSMEVFLMKDRQSGFYSQYVCSASGVNIAYHMKNGKTSYEPMTTPLRGGALGATAELFKRGYKVFMEIDLANIGLDQVKEGDTFLIQVARNFRGQFSERCKIMQLFPNDAYGKDETNANNHDRKSFQPVKIICAEKLEKK